MHIIRKKGYQNIDYRKLVTCLYNSFLRAVVYCRKNRCKKESSLKPPSKNNEWRLNCDDKKIKKEITSQDSSWKKVFSVEGHLVHFSLHFALHINELLKLYDITLCMFETKIEGVAMQTAN